MIERINDRNQNIKEKRKRKEKEREGLFFLAAAENARVRVGEKEPFGCRKEK